MRKEVSIAIIIGIILGAIILYGINLANKSSSSLPKPPSQNENLPIVTPTAEASTSSVLIITSHSNNEVLFTKEITVSGKTTPNTKLSIIWEEDEIITTSDNIGNFIQKISLISGENNIQFDVVNSNNTLQSQTLKLFYSSKPIE